MTRKLEELFGFDQHPEEAVEGNKTPEETKAAITEIDATIDKIDAALPGIRDLDTSDKELDELASTAQETFDDLMDLGMQIDSRYSSEIFAVASTMMGHALTAKTAKLNKKLKMIDLQMKKLKLDQDAAKNATSDSVQVGQGQVLNQLSRNELLEKLIDSRDQKDN